jgi:hypothetical protein
VFLPNRLSEHSKILSEGKKKVEDLKKIQENLEKVKLIKEERGSLTTHINLADHIAKKQKSPLARNYLIMEQSILAGDISNEVYEFIDNELTKKNEEYNLLKIICLISGVKNGLKSKIYDQLKRDFLQIYGFQELFLLNNLEKLNILKYYSSSNIFYYDLNKKLELINESVDFINPNDTSYSFSGYCPIFIRLIEKAISKGWNTINDLIKKISNEFQFPNDENKIININKKEKDFILLIFIGGITYGELAAIRYLNNSLKNKKFIVLTTGMINSKKIFNSLRLGKYKYLPKDNNYFNIGKNNNTQVKLNDVLTFKDFYEQINKT